MMFHIRKVHNHVFDVFLGTGFDHWVRVRRTHYGVAPISGMRLPRHVFKAIAARLEQFN